MAEAFLERWFGFTERHTDLATEVRAGVTTFMVMAYIIFVNPIVLGYSGVAGLEGKGLPFSPTLTVTCLTAGLLSIAMGIASNYPFALAPGMGLNAVVAFELVAGRGLTWPQAMTIVFLEGVVITLLVLTRFRQAMLDAVPLGLKRAISVGIGLFIAFIGFFTAGFVVKPDKSPLPVGLGRFDTLPAVVFVLGFVLTAWLMARRVGGKGGFLDAHGRLPRVDRVLLVDSLGAAAGGLANASSNTTYIESAAGVAEGGRTGLVPVVTGVLFLGAMWLSPLASVIPAQATAPALVIVGFYMMAVGRDIPLGDFDEAGPAFGTLLGMPFTWSITNGIGAGFVTFAAIRLLSGQGRRVHWMVYAASLAFVVYFALPLVERALGG